MGLHITKGAAGGFLLPLASLQWRGPNRGLALKVGWYLQIDLMMT